MLQMLSPIDITESGITTVFILHILKAERPIVCNPSGSITFSIFNLLKAKFSIVFKFLGILTFVRLTQWNASLPIVVIVFGRTTLTTFKFVWIPCNIRSLSLLFWKLTFSKFTVMLIFFNAMLLSNEAIETGLVYSISAVPLNINLYSPLWSAAYFFKASSIVWVVH